MGKKIPVRINKVLTETKNRLNALYAQRKHELVLFGSYARGDFSTGAGVPEPGVQ